MSAIIKSGDETVRAAVRAAPWQIDAAATPAVAAPVDDRESRLEQRIAELEAKCDALTAEARTLRDDARIAHERGEAAGREQGRKAAQDLQAERMERLGKAIDTAQTKLDEALLETERLAALMAGACLDKLFGDADHGADRVKAILRTQMQHLEKQSILAINVSTADFSDASLDALAQMVGADNIAIRCDPDMRTGDCTVKLQLGEIDIGLSTQWHAIRSLLVETAQQDAG